MTDDNLSEAAKPALEITQQDAARANTAASALDSVSGFTQDQINLRNLQAELDVYEAKEASYIDQNCMMPRQEQAKLDSLRATLTYQKQLIRKHGADRRGDVARVSEREQDLSALENARKSNMKTAVSRIMQDEGLTKFEAVQLIDMRLRADGERAEEELLPQFHSIKARLRTKYADVAAGSPNSSSNISPVQQQARSEFSEINSRVKAAISAGQAPDLKDMKRLDELSQYI